MGNDTDSLKTVSKEYSYRLALKSTLFVCVGALFAILLLSIILGREEASSYAESFHMLSGVRNELLYKSIVIYLITSFFTIAGIILITLLYSHRVAGPVYKLELSARRIASGDLSGKVTMRKYDVIRPMADDLNRIIATYRETLAQVESELGDLKGKVSAIPETGSPMPGDDFQRVTADISIKTEEMNNILSKIKL